GAILPLNEESMIGAGWLNQTAASALRGARSVTELNQQKRKCFFQGWRPAKNDHQTSGRLIHVVCQQTLRRSLGILRASNPRVLALWSLLSARLGRGWTTADLVETASGFGRPIPEGTLRDARHRPR